MKSKIVIITGAMATGKTSILNSLRNVSDVFTFSKDEIKEELFNSFDNLDLELTKRLGNASFSILLDLTDRVTTKGQSIVIEGNFRPKYNEAQVNDIVNKNKCDVLQILCKANSETILERIRSRQELGDRHKGHGDLNRDEEFERQISSGDYRFFDIEGSETIEVDMSLINDKKIKGIVNKIVTFLTN